MKQPIEKLIEWMEDEFGNILSESQIESISEKALDIQQLSKEEPTWISVEKELPKYGTYVLVVGTDRMQYDIERNHVCEMNDLEDGVDFKETGLFWWLTESGRRIEKVTHWQPLPTPPKKLNNMNNLLIALQKIEEMLCSKDIVNGEYLNSILSVATEAINSFKGERSFSKEEICGFAEWTQKSNESYMWQINYDDTEFYNPIEGSGVWYHEDDYDNITPFTTQQLFKMYQSLSPLKEATDKTSILSWGNNGELICTPKEQPISSVENEDLEQIIIDQINLSFNEHTGSNEAIQDAAYFLAKRFEGYKAANNHLEVLEKWLISKGGYDKFDSLYITDILNKIKELKYNH